MDVFQRAVPTKAAKGGRKVIDQPGLSTGSSLNSVSMKSSRRFMQCGLSLCCAYRKACIAVRSSRWIYGTVIGISLRSWCNSDTARQLQRRGSWFSCYVISFYLRLRSFAVSQPKRATLPVKAIETTMANNCFNLSNPSISSESIGAHQ
jgi:hypothetical protein